MRRVSSSQSSLLLSCGQYSEDKSDVLERWKRDADELLLMPSPGACMPMELGPGSSGMVAMVAGGGLARMLTLLFPELKLLCQLTPPLRLLASGAHPSPKMPPRRALEPELSSETVESDPDACGPLPPDQLPIPAPKAER